MSEFAREFLSEFVSLVRQSVPRTFICGHTWRVGGVSETTFYGAGTVLETVHALYGRSKIGSSSNQAIYEHMWAGKTGIRNKVICGRRRREF